MINLSLIATSSNLVQDMARSEVLSCNELTASYGLTLTEQQATALVTTRGEVLKKTGRIEWNGGILQKIIIAFCDSPYLTEQNYEDTLHELIELFYEFKNDTLDGVTDDKLIEFMKVSFNGKCCGSLELLASRELTDLAKHIHGGHSFESFKWSGEDSYDKA